ncbi:MAG: 4-hydroxybenzoate octaprenyltransferase [Actinomycetota bacterium]
MTGTPVEGAGAGEAGELASVSGKGVRGRLRSFASDIALTHSVFALPFAYTSAFFGARGFPGWARLGWLTLAMVGARTFAMAANRLVDRRLDALNPRTAGRALPSGAMKAGDMLAFAAVALAVFLFAVWQLPPLTHKLWPFALVPLVVYPYGKRFTWGGHYLLAVAQAVGPVGAWIAVTGAWSWKAVVLGCAVGLWVGGFDVIYATQDVEADRTVGVHSLPADFGVAFALWASRATHAVCAGLFAWFGVVAGAGSFYWVGLGAAAAMLAYEQSLVRPGDLSRVNRAFFTVNGVVSVAFFAFAAADVMLAAG